ncbi:solute carrier family 35, member C2 [Nematocida minor]|uniref:solute carrier family 35, member C2 n=1 Tax=Nematocida minor TaxID=1912983 RepID=UPI002220BB58|nr:solute carrier family 35, member C2 [Nematocida minor]KAI5190804.1 solute carrier family 35, member C2 [Nematocida minor]
MKTREALGIGACISFFFATSLGHSYFSSYFLSVHGYNFEFPLLYFSLHQLIHFVLASFGIWYLKKGILHEQAIESPLPYIMRERIGSPLASSQTESPQKREYAETPARSTKTAANSVLYHIYQFLNDIGAFNVWIVVCSFIGSIDSGFSGHALTQISLPFYTMLKSTTPIFILFARFIFQLERPSFTLVGIIFMIASGISLAAKSDTVQFNIKYGIMIIGACVMAGFRWGFLEYFIKHSTKKNDSILHSLSVISLLSSIFLFAGFFLFEGAFSFLNCDKCVSSASIFLCFFLIFATGVIGFFGCLAEFVVISKTNVMVSSVVMIIKEIAILCISVQRKELILSAVNVFGLCISVTGIVLFTFRSVLFPVDPVKETAQPQDSTEELVKRVEKYAVSTEPSPIMLTS